MILLARKPHSQCTTQAIVTVHTTIFHSTWIPPNTTTSPYSSLDYCAVFWYKHKQFEPYRQPLQGYSYLSPKQGEVLTCLLYKPLNDSFVHPYVLKIVALNWVQAQYEARMFWFSVDHLDMKTLRSHNLCALKSLSAASLHLTGGLTASSMANHDNPFISHDHLRCLVNKLKIVSYFWVASLLGHILWSKK